MNPTLLRILIAVFFIAHGWIHFSLSYVPLPQPGAIHTPFWPSWWRDATDSDWLAAKIGLGQGTVRTIGWLLWAGTLAGFVLAGLGLLGLPLLKAIWQPLVMAGSLLSLVLLAFYWHPWLVMGAVLDLACLAGLWMNWPKALFTT